MKRHRSLWRVFATGFGFVAFGLGGASLGISIILAIFPLPLPRQKKYTIVRRIISISFRFYIAMLRAMGLLTCDMSDLKQIASSSKGHLLIANHPSLLDVVLLISVLPRANCVIKQALRGNPFTLLPTLTAGYIPNGDKNLLYKCKESLAQGDTLIIFPEGTRTSPGKPPTLVRGFANIAIAAQHDITPVLIRCSPPALAKGSPWYNIPASPPHFSLRVLPTLSIKAYLDKPPSKGSRQLARDMTGLYNSLLGFGV